jgi:hypothetical protein
VVEALDEGGLAEVVLPEVCAAEGERSVVVGALGDGVQVLEEGDGRIVLARLTGADQGFDAVPGARYVVGDGVEPLLAPLLACMFFAGQDRGVFGFGAAFPFEAVLSGGVQQFGDGPPVPFCAPGSWCAVEPPQQLHVHGRGLVACHTNEQPVLLCGGKCGDPGGRLFGILGRGVQRRAGLGGDAQQVTVGA